MINMAVVNLKDVFKYLVKTSIILIIILVITRYFLNNNLNKINSNILNIDVDYTYVLKSTIPIFGQTNIDENLDNKEQYNLLQKVLTSEITMLSAIEDNKTVIAEETEKKKEIKNIDKSKSEKVEENIEKLSTVKTDLKTEVIETNVPNKYTDIIDGVEIKNETDHNLTKEIQDTNIELNLKNVLIYHTHTCESYTSSEKHKYKQTGNYRTTDKNFSVVRVGRELENYLKSSGFNTIHDETYHDYPSYTGSYYNSLETIQNILKDNNDYDIVFDIHRDAIRR